MEPAEIHIWHIRQDAGAADSAATVLSMDESARAARFRFPRDSARYTITRAALREILAIYTGMDPAAIRFRYGTRGKPALAFESPVRFNVSHSGGLAMVAVTEEREIGVDVEQIERKVEVEAIARRFFQAAEAEAVLAAPEAGRRREFFRLWTRKEAMLKALGAGISGGLSSVVPEGWSVTEIDAGSGFAAAVAIQGEGLPVRHVCYWRLPGDFE